MGEESQKLRGVTIIKDDIPSDIAPTCDVIYSPEDFKPQRTCHETGDFTKRLHTPLFLAPYGFSLLNSFSRMVY